LPKVRFASSDVLCVIVGDGVAPRTAALCAMRTKWRRVLSVDPVLFNSACANGLVEAGAGHGPHVAAAIAGYARQGTQSERKTEKLRRQCEQWKRVERLELLRLPIEQAIIEVPSGISHVVVILPHAHVVPDASLGALRFDEAAETGRLPSLSVIQIPCCSYVKHDTVCNQPPNVEYIDENICGKTHGGARAVRVWTDVCQEAVAARAVRLGDRPPLTSRLVARQQKKR